VEDTKDLDALVAFTVENEVATDRDKPDAGQQIRPQLTKSGVPGKPPAFFFDSIR
jgi:hypothetical protein